MNFQKPVTSFQSTLNVTHVAAGVNPSKAAPPSCVQEKCGQQAMMCVFKCGNDKNCLSLCATKQEQACIQSCLS
jgi:hypothetical protein